MSDFKWTKQKGDVALGLAEGKTQKEVAEEHDISDRTIQRWLQEPEFSAEVDRLSLMVGVASRAERLRIAKRVIRQKTKDETILTEKDLLDWLKFAQSETDGIKLELTSLLEATASLADTGQARTGKETE